MKNKCEMNDDECKNEAKYECPECGQMYCIECASYCDYVCDCIEPPRLERIKRVKRNAR